MRIPDLVLLRCCNVGVGGVGFLQITSNHRDAIEFIAMPARRWRRGESVKRAWKTLLKSLGVTHSELREAIGFRERIVFCCCVWCPCTSVYAAMTHIARAPQFDWHFRCDEASAEMPRTTHMRGGIGASAVCVSVTLGPLAAMHKIEQNYKLHFALRECSRATRKCTHTGECARWRAVARSVVRSRSSPRGGYKYL